MKLNDVALIPRSALFGNPERGSCQVSPCGRWLAFLAPVEGAMNIWVAERGEDVAASFSKAAVVTADRGRGIYEFMWARDGVHLLYLQDKDGDEDTHVYAVPAAGGVARDLTPFAGARASIQQVSRKKPGSILLTHNKRDARYADLFQADLASGELTLVAENKGFYGFVADEDYRVRLAMGPSATGGHVFLKPDGQGWKLWREIAASDSSNSSPQALHENGRILYMLDSTGRDTSALLSFDLEADGADGTLIATHPSADISGVWTDIKTHEPLAWTATFERREIHVLDESLRADVEALDAAQIGEWGVASRTDDDQFWIVSAGTDKSPRTFHAYNRPAKKLVTLYDVRPALAGAPLARMQHTTLKARDGLDLVTYLTLPLFADDPAVPLTSKQRVPLVLDVHGGPQARDTWGYNPIHQWLANRGYAVMSVNFRGSTGFGKRFVSAGDGQWGAKMDDDLIDAVQWAIGQGIADPDRLCVMGASYGGYATLWAMTAHPDVYACGVDIVGPSNLETLASSIPAYWEAAKAQLFRMIGDAGTDAGRALMRERSPVHRAGLIRKPLLIGQGANDPRVKQAESDQMVAAMKANGVPVTYVLFPDEGHGFHRPANTIKFNAVTEQFLAKYLGGRFEASGPGEADGNTAVFVEDSLK